MNYILIIMTLLLLSSQALADCDDTRLTLSDELAIDKEHSLMWARCTLGTQLKSGSCTGPGDRYNWMQAKSKIADMNKKSGHGGYDDWRLPTEEELLLLVENGCYNPSLNPGVFPDTFSNGYWSSSEDPGSQQHAIVVFFLHGKPFTGNKTQEWFVRMVRHVD